MNNIFVNTIPHSGTHLVTKIIESLGYEHAVVKNRFYTVKPFYRRQQKAGINWRTSKEIAISPLSFEKKTVLVSVASPRLVKPSLVSRTFSEIYDYKYIIGHMPFSKDGNEVLEKYIKKTITIIRDPRDMAISMINHSRTRPLHHAHRYLFKKLHNDSERLHAVIEGYDNDFGSLIGLNSMYDSMLQWKNQSTNLTIKFEDLVGQKGGGTLEKQIKTIKSIIAHLNIPRKISDDEILSIADTSFGVSGTFRKGKIGGWKNIFLDKDKEFFKLKVNKVLVKNGYESNNQW